jgi:hypothetical protein
MKYILASAVMLFTTNAEAGALGIIGHGGMYEGKAYYYRSDGLQGIDSQYRPSAGLGFETLLGDKDDRLIGQLRLGWNHDWAINNPEYTETKDENGNSYTYTHPDYSTSEPRNDGLISVGLQWGLWGEPTGFQVIAATSFASGFWTIDNLEYFIVEVGPGVTYTINDQYQFHSTVCFAPRYRKQMYLGMTTYAGVRYLFD